MFKTINEALEYIEKQQRLREERLKEKRYMFVWGQVVPQMVLERCIKNLLRSLQTKV